MNFRRSASFSSAATAIAAIVAGSALLTGCTLGESSNNPGVHGPDSTAASAPASSATRGKEADNGPAGVGDAQQFTEASVTIRSVGDILIHE